MGRFAFYFVHRSGSDGIEKNGTREAGSEYKLMTDVRLDAVENAVKAPARSI